MRGPDLVGYEPTRVYWSQDSRRVYFRWKRAGEARLKEPDLYVVNRDGGGLRKLTEEEAKGAAPPAGDLSKDKTMTVFAEEGDIFIYDQVKNERRQITSTVEGENGPRFTKDQKHIVFTRQNNLYRMALDGAGMTQLTDIRTGAAPAETPPPQRGVGGGGGQRRQGAAGDQTSQQRGNESQEYVKKEERELIEAVRERAQNREEQEAKRKQREKRKPFTPPAGSICRRTCSYRPTENTSSLRSSGRRPGRRTPSCRTTSLSRPTPKIFPAVTRLATSKAALDWRLFLSRPAT